MLFKQILNTHYTIGKHCSSESISGVEPIVFKLFVISNCSYFQKHFEEADDSTFSAGGCAFAGHHERLHQEVYFLS